MNRQVSSYTKSRFHPIRWLAMGVSLLLWVGCQHSSTDASQKENSGSGQSMSDTGVAKKAAELIGKPLTIPEIGLEMVWIRPGTFTMGSPSDEEVRSSDEKQHEVTLTQGFWLGKYEVTQEEWEDVMGNNPSNFKASGKRAPVERVSWEDAKAFCQKLNEREEKAGRLPLGYKYSLPTEAQWEYACRAGTETPFAFGNSLRSKKANKANFYGNKTVSVGSYSPNAWGLYDMSGNVAEWCEDWYDSDYPTGSVTNPVGPASGSARVLRGGSWRSYAIYCRSAGRSGAPPSSRYEIIGFRLTLTSASVR